VQMIDRPYSVFQSHPHKSPSRRATSEGIKNSVLKARVEYGAVKRRQTLQPPLSRVSHCAVTSVLNKPDEDGIAQQGFS
jgi:hypothetical protein